MNDIFSGCSDLVALPDISAWDLSSVKNISFMFYGCSSLNCLPQLEKWNLSNVSEIEGMFLDCSSLRKVPDIKWDCDKIRYPNSVFGSCHNLVFLPKNMGFYSKNIIYKNIEGCINLLSF